MPPTPVHNTYSELDSGLVCETIERLVRRIAERFPSSGLSKVAAELLRVAQENQRVIEKLRRPTWWVRSATVITVLILIALLSWIGLRIFEMLQARTESPSDLIQGIDAATNLLLFFSLGVMFLISLEGRIKRRGALAMLHRLRSIAHVVDMHQLTKDPEHALRSCDATPSSPERTLSPAQLDRYLDYCSELFALTSKLAALHAQHLQDPVVLDAVNDIESLTSDFYRTTWQKITILSQAAAAK